MNTSSKLVPVLVALHACFAFAAEKVVHFTVDPSQDRRRISPYIYGMNQHTRTAPSRTLTRIGGNRWTAYNWENNASNAGSDWHHQSDDHLSKSNEPGAPVREVLEQAAKNKQALVITVPICGYVAADKDREGDVKQTPDYLNTRFKKTLAKKNAPLSLVPDLNDAFVYQDEFVNWVEKSKPDPNQTIFCSLDNEPDTWHATHARIHPDKVTYAELLQKTIDFAGAIKDVKPDAIVFGAVNYGWNGYRTLQNAPDANDRDFHQFFLAGMKKAEAKAGRRLLDVIDVHWYPEATGDDVRITGAHVTPGAAKARMQAPRSLWDPTYVEKSWITKDNTLGEPITMITRLKRDVETHYPGTRIAITEYNYGAGDHISGGIAQADVLGIFGREGIFAAAWWDEDKGRKFIEAVFDLYRDFEDTSIPSTTDDIEATAIHASVDANDASKMTIVLINRSESEVTAEIAIKHDAQLTTCEAFQLTSEEAKIQKRREIKLQKPNEIKYALPAYSVTMLRATR